MRRQVEVSNEAAAALGADGDAILRALDEHVECDVYLRGNVVTLDGDEAAVEAAATVVAELAELADQGHEIAPGTISAVTGALDAHESPARILDDVVWRHRALKVAPKTVNQKRYVDAIRDRTVTFGVGPAGTGKTFLAVALAAAALSRREVNRIILTRPAVEAGERLGFLPGDLMAKVDPYLRPLFDALHDMLDPDKVAGHLERGVIEVAPLAFMRGRAQPVDRKVLTPEGWRTIGSLEVGDLVVGSDGRPTPVLGVHPQGRKEIFRVRAQDGASTFCCADHLWTVRTPERTVDTREMSRRLRRGERLELPLLSAPAHFDPAAARAAPALALSGAAHSHRVDTSACSASSTVHSMDGGPLGTEVLFGSPAVRLGALRGLLESDPGLAGAVVDPALAEQVRFLAGSLGGVAAAAPGDAGMEISLPGALAPPGVATEPTRFVEAIEPAGDAECVCIQVAAEDSLYVTDEFLLTHNTLNDSFIILDEAQNTTPEQMKMFLTRLGFGSKMVITGDITQVDLPRDQQSGLIVVGDILREVDGVEFVRFGGEDVVRHRLVQRIVEAYDEHSERQAPELRPADPRRKPA